MNGVIPPVIWCNTTTNAYTEVFIRIEKNGVIPPVVSTMNILWESATESY